MESTPTRNRMKQELTMETRRRLALGLVIGPVHKNRRRKQKFNIITIAVGLAILAIAFIAACRPF